MSYIYLASPYTHPDRKVMQERYDRTCNAAARLILDGHVVFSPIAHSHSIGGYLPEPVRLGHELWMRQDRALLRHARELWMLTLHGWEESRGMTVERELAERLGIPVRFVAPPDSGAACVRPPATIVDEAAVPVAQI